MDQRKQQSYTDRDESVHLLAIAVKYYLEAEAVGKWNSKDFPSKWQKLADVSTQKLNCKVVVGEKLLSKILKTDRVRKRSCVEEENLAKVKAEILLEDLVLPRTLFEVGSW